jgi:hypothetical protein
VEQPDRAGAENSAGFCLGRVRGVRALLSPVCGACGLASQAKSRGALANWQAALATAVSSTLPWVEAERVTP